MDLYNLEDEEKNQKYENQQKSLEETASQLRKSQDDLEELKIHHKKEMDLTRSKFEE